MASESLCYPVSSQCKTKPHVHICDSRKCTNDNVHRRQILFGEDLIKIAYKDVSECDYFTKCNDIGSFIGRPDEVGAKKSSKVL